MTPHTRIHTRMRSMICSRTVLILPTSPASKWIQKLVTIMSMISLGMKPPVWPALHA